MQLFNEKYIDVILGCDNSIRYNRDINSEYDKLYISYVGIDELINFFKSADGLLLSEKVYNSNLNLIILPTDSLCISGENDYDILKMDLFLHENVNFFHSWFSKIKNFKIYFGIHIHKNINEFISSQIENKIEVSKKVKHFFTLNNKFNGYRKKLLDFYNTLSLDNKEKIIASFNFNELYFDSFQTINEQYGNSLNNLYNDCLIEIVNESAICSISEKSYKPILAGIPFIYWYGDEDVKFSYQIEYFNHIGIDTTYFGIDYSNHNSVIQKINEILTLPISEVVQQYETEFVKAEENKKKLFDYLSNIKTIIQ